MYKEQLKSRLKEYEDLIYGRVGLHIFFILLADRFLRKNGRVALVLPATVLRIVSMKGIRRLWVSNYHIEYIITTWERAAFSEAAQFREILFVAKKLKDRREKEGEVPDTLKCAVVVLKKLPKTSEEAKKVANAIYAKKLETAVGSTYEDAIMTLVAISQGELKKNVENLFTLISISDPRLRELWHQTVQKADNKLVECNRHFKENIIEAYEDVYIPPFNSTFIIQRSRAIKKHDVWVIKEERPDSIVAQHRFLQMVVNIPLSILERGFRRPAGCSILDISNDLDYIVVNRFSDAEHIFPNKTQATKALGEISRWREIVNLKKATWSFQGALTCLRKEQSFWLSIHQHLFLELTCGVLKDLATMTPRFLLCGSTAH